MHVALFKLAPAKTRNGVSCDASGAFIGTIPLLERAKTNAGEKWTPRDVKAISRDLSRCLGLPVNASQKAAGIAAIAKALNAGGVARAQMLKLFLRFPDPTPVTRANPSRADIFKFVDDLISGGFIKFNSNHWPAGVPDDQGGEFAPKGEGGGAAAQAPQPGSSDVDSFGHQVTPDERAALDRLGAAPLNGSQPSTSSNTSSSQTGGSNQSVPHKVKVTAADMAKFGPQHRQEAEQLAAKLGYGATAAEFLALSSVESGWGTSDQAQQAHNYFGIHNSEKGPFPGQAGTYVASGIEGVPGQLDDRWLPPVKGPIQRVAVFSSGNGYMESGSVVVAALSTSKALAESGGSYSDPAVFFATVHKHSWGFGVRKDYVRTMLERIRYF